MAAFRNTCIPDAAKRPMDINELDAMKPIPPYSSTYQVMLHLTHGSPGMKFDYSEGDCMRVSSIEEGGSAWRHNERSMPEERIRVGDFIIEVNGVTKSPKAMLTSMQCQTCVLLNMRRAFQFVADIAKPPEGFGLNLSCHPHSTALVITAVDEVGAIACWNRSGNKEYQIKTNDHILSINRKFGDAAALLDEMKNCESVEMVIARPTEMPYVGQVHV